MKYKMSINKKSAIMSDLSKNSKAKKRADKKGINEEFRAIKTQKMQKNAEKHKLAEANVRRKVAKAWEYVGHSKKYKRSAAREFCKRITVDVEENLLDGIFYDLNEHNSHKSIAVQKRVLRRIVEKRHAQAIDRIAQGMDPRQVAHLVRRYTGDCLDSIHKYQYSA